MSRQALFKSEVLAIFSLFNGLILQADQFESYVNTRRIILPSWNPTVDIFHHDNLTFPLGDYGFTESLEMCISSLGVPGDSILALAQKQPSPFACNLNKECDDKQPFYGLESLHYESDPAVMDTNTNIAVMC